MSTLRRIGHRIMDADGCAVEVIDGPIPAAHELERERIIETDRDIGMVDADGCSLRVGDWVQILDGSDGIVGPAGVVSALINDKGIRARVQDKPSNPTWGAWCKPIQIRKVSKRVDQRMMRAS